MKFMAVQCYSCGLLQVKQVRKSGNKWSCTICNEKQSVRKVYTTSDTAKDVRAYVQKFNLSSGLAAEAEAMKSIDAAAEWLEESSIDCLNEKQESIRAKDVSKWDTYLPEEEQVYSESWDVSEQTSEDNKFVTCLPDPPSYKRKKSQFSPGQPEEDVAILREKSMPRNTIASGRKEKVSYWSRTDKTANLKQNYDDVFYESTPLCENSIVPAMQESPSTALQSSPKKAKSYQFDSNNKGLVVSRTRKSEVPTSKWSKYL